MANFKVVWLSNHESYTFSLSSDNFNANTFFQTLMKNKLRRTKGFEDFRMNVASKSDQLIHVQYLDADDDLISLGNTATEFECFKKSVLAVMKHECVATIFVSFRHKESSKEKLDWLSGNIPNLVESKTEKGVLENSEVDNTTESCKITTEKKKISNASELFNSMNNLSLQDGSLTPQNRHLKDALVQDISEVLKQVVAEPLKELTKKCAKEDNKESIPNHTAYKGSFDPAFGLMAREIFSCYVAGNMPADLRQLDENLIFMSQNPPTVCLRPNYTYSTAMILVTRGLYLLADDCKTMNLKITRSDLMDIDFCVSDYKVRKLCGVLCVKFEVRTPESVGSYQINFQVEFGDEKVGRAIECVVIVPDMSKLSFGCFDIPWISSSNYINSNKTETNHEDTQKLASKALPRFKRVTEKLQRRNKQKESDKGNEAGEQEGDIKLNVCDATTIMQQPPPVQQFESDKQKEDKDEGYVDADEPSNNNNTNHHHDNDVQNPNNHPVTRDDNSSSAEYESDSNVSSISLLNDAKELMMDDSDSSVDKLRIPDCFNVNKKFVKQTKSADLQLKIQPQCTDNNEANPSEEGGVSMNDSSVQAAVCNMDGETDRHLLDTSSLALSGSTNMSVFSSGDESTSNESTKKTKAAMNKAKNNSDDKTKTEVASIDILPASVVNAAASVIGQIMPSIDTQHSSKSNQQPYQKLDAAIAQSFDSFAHSTRNNEAAKSVNNANQEPIPNVGQVYVQIVYDDGQMLHEQPAVLIHPQDVQQQTQIAQEFKKHPGTTSQQFSQPSYPTTVYTTMVPLPTTCLPQPPMSSSQASLNNPQGSSYTVLPDNTSHPSPKAYSQSTMRVMDLGGSPLQRKHRTSPMTNSSGALGFSQPSMLQQGGQTPLSAATYPTSTQTTYAAYPQSTYSVYPQSVYSVCQQSTYPLYTQSTHPSQSHATDLSYSRAVSGKQGTVDSQMQRQLQQASSPFRYSGSRG